MSRRRIGKRGQKLFIVLKFNAYSSPLLQLTFEAYCEVVAALHFCFKSVQKIGSLYS
jgi:hypothetical protein